MHLFDIDVEGGIRFKESDVLSAGSEFVTFNIEDFKIGLGICYDIRFEEHARIYRNMGKNIQPIIKDNLKIINHEIFK